LDVIHYGRLVIAPFLFCLAIDAFAINLLDNPDFDPAMELSGWSATNASQGAATYDDSDGSPAPGSVLLTGVACCTVLAAQCLKIDAGVRYDFGASLKEGPTAPGLPTDGTSVELYWYQDTVNACNTIGIGTASIVPSLTTSWQSYSGSAVAPPTAAYVLYRIAQYNFAGLPDLTSYGDSAYFYADTIFGDGFEVVP
jgi:hypothetical protein